MKFLTSFLIVGSLLSVIILFFYHFKYIKKADFGLWGVALLADILFTALFAVMASVLNIPQEKACFIGGELTGLVSFCLILSIYYHQKIVSENIIWAVFLLFVAIWITELNSYLRTTDMRNFGSLTYTSVFMCIVIVVGVLIYWLGLFRKNALFFLKDPFFWISLGWFIFYLLISTTYIPITKNSEFVKNVIIGDVSLAGVLSNICYCIAFWKAKDWVLKGFVK